MMSYKIGLTITLLTLFLSLTAAFGQYQKPNDYMGAISEQSGKIKTDMWEYSRTLAHNNNDRKIDAKRKEIIQTVSNAINVISEMSAFENDFSYRDSTLSYLKLTKQILNQDYAEIVNMEAIAEESFDNMEAYITAQMEASRKLKNAAKRLALGQKSFAKNHDVTLVEAEDEIANKLEIAGKVFEYQNAIYLIFFKSFKQEVYLIEAMNRGDISAMEQNYKNLAVFANEGIEELERIKPYNSDNQLRKACLEVLKFYKDEAENKTPVLIDFFLQQERLQNVKSAFEAKEEKTQQDVDTYNTMVEQYNEAMNAFNTTNADLNTRRSELVNLWNLTQDEFTEKHVPKK